MTTNSSQTMAAAVDRTIDVLSAMKAVTDQVEAHQLLVSHVNVTPGQPGASAWNPETRKYDAPVLPKIFVHTPWEPATEFLRWADVLGATTASVERRDFDTVLQVHVRHGGFSWSVGGRLLRPKDGGPRLPGATVEWDRTPSGRASSHGSTTIADLRAALAALGEA